MRFSISNKLLSTKKIFTILLLICSCLLVVGCSENGKAEEKKTSETNSSVNQNKEVIQAVIEKEFNGPDKKFRELWDAVMATQTADMSQEEYDATLEAPEYKEYINYMKDTYAPYFTEKGYDIFSKTEAFSYSLSDEEYKINTSDIQINQSGNGERNYNSTFNVNYVNENGETNTYSFEGKSIVTEEGKIGKINFYDKDGLRQKINE